MKLQRAISSRKTDLNMPNNYVQTYHGFPYARRLEFWDKIFVRGVTRSNGRALCLVHKKFKFTVQNLAAF